MIEAVFISDLHLHPERLDIQARFKQFITWCKYQKIKRLYILGDFFHVWAGDDALDAWSCAIAQQLQELRQQNIDIFFLPGNRDFLLGETFAKLAGFTILPEPSLINLGGEEVLLVHGDKYCTKDKKHQIFRRFTRNRLFSFLFLSLPLSLRLQLANKLRNISQNKGEKDLMRMDVNKKSVIKEMNKLKVETLIHGHTHKEGISSYKLAKKQLKRYVLSDWDDFPNLLCYYSTNEFKFNHDWLGVS